MMSTLTGPEKAVLFILSLEEEIALPIINGLEEPELRKLREVAATMSEVQAGAVDEVYREFLDRTESAVAVPRGGLGYLRRLTAGALGEERARAVFEGGAQSPLDRLEAARPEMLATLLEREPPQLVAAVLAQIDPAKAAAILAVMTPERQHAVVDRVGRLTQLSAGALEDVASALVGELPSSDTESLISIDGIASAAQILNASSQESARQLLQQIEDVEPEFAQRVRLAMFAFDDLARLDPKTMRTLLREVPTERLTIALKGASPAVCNAIFAGLSARASELMRDDLELIGNVRRSEVTKAREEVVEIALRLESEGTVDLGRGGD
jgi:flagellar motor switch protein FliG